MLIESKTQTVAAEPNSWPQAAVRTAVAAGMFCLAISAWLVFSYFQTRAFNPLTSQELVELKATLTRSPQDEGLKTKIRALDLALRQQQARHLALCERGAWLLLGGAVVFLAAIKLGTWRKKLPRPTKGARPRDTAERSAIIGQWGVACLGLILGSGIWILASRSESDLTSQAMKMAVASAAPSPNATPLPQPTTPFPTAEEIRQQWPRFRGPGGLGISAYTNVPVSWNLETGQNVLWKTAVPLAGPNSPVLWGNRLFLLGANKTKREFYCFDTASGKLLWQKSLDVPGTDPEPPTVMEDTGGYVPGTAATDGRRVYGMFANGNVGAFDLNGNPVWAKDLGKPDNSYGQSSSLDLYQNRLLIQFDQGTGKDGKSKLLALDTLTGEKVWESQPRPVPNSWSSPILINTGQREQIITCGKPWVMAYDPSNGTEIWRAQVLYGEVTPSPIFAAGLVFTAMEGEKLSAIRPDGAGDVTKTHVAWSGEDGLPDICSPLSDGQRVYLLTSGGTLTCYDIASGKKSWEKDLELEVHSSPSLAGDAIYLLGLKGKVIVVKAGPEFKELARSELGEEVLSSPAFANGRLFIRAKQHLFCLGNKPK